MSKLLRIMGLFKLPDDFTGTHVDAVELLARHLREEPRPIEPFPPGPDSPCPEDVFRATDNLVAALWPGFTAGDRRARLGISVDEFDGEKWRTLPDSLIDGVVRDTPKP